MFVRPGSGVEPIAHMKYSVWINLASLSGRPVRALFKFFFAGGFAAHNSVIS